MKARTIKAVLVKKHKELVDSIDDERVAKLVKNNTIITGGCIASMLLGEKVNDYDLYFRNHETTLAVAEYYVKRFNERNPGSGKASSGERIDAFVKNEKGRVEVYIKSVGIAAEGGEENKYRYFEGDLDPEAIGAMEYVEAAMGKVDAIEEAEDSELPKYRPVFMSSNAITLSQKVQVVLRFYGDPNEIHNNYDFVHCTSYWDSGSGELVLPPAALEALITRELRYVGSKYPLCSLFRLRKFIARGWTVNAGTILKIAMQVKDLDLYNMEVLQDQLTGVDAAYFYEVVEKLKERDKAQVDKAYLLEIIDRMF